MILNSFVKTAVAVFLLTIISYGQTQKDSHDYGLTASFSGTQLDILFPIKTSESMTLSPGIGFISIGEQYSEFNISLSPKFYFGNSNVKPFLGIRGAMLLLTPNEGDSITDYLLGILGGGEYFFTDQFSVGIEAQLNMSISNELSLRFGNPDQTNINTATNIFMSIYF